MGASTNAQLRDLVYKTLGFSDSSAQETIAEIALNLTRNGLIFTKSAVDAADNTATDISTMPLDAKVLVTAVTIMPLAALTSNDTNYATIVVDVADGASGSATTIASVTTKTAGSGGTGNWTAGTAITMTLTATVANLLIDGATARKWMGVNIAKSGTGVAVPASMYWFTFKLV